MDLHIPRGLPSRQARFLCLLAARPSLSRADYERLIDVSYTTAKRDLAQLTLTGLIVGFGHTRMRRYALSPLALIPPNSCEATNETDKGRIKPGSSGSHPNTIRISIDPISV
ncbi:MAG TPA: hypothetical protein VKU60_07830 [Chloroflexota bacterium]|nr:hypothetical protein [Chloroflexota bacterium]